MTYNNEYKRHFFMCLCLLVILFTCTALNAQERVHLKRADLLTNEVIEGETVRKLIGNVVVQQGGVTLFSDRVTHFQTLNKWIFEGNIRIQEPEKELRSNYIVYDVEINRFYFRNSIELYRDGSILTARRAVYFPDDRHYSCAGDVQYKREVDEVCADSADFFEEEGIVKAFENVRYRNSREGIRLTGGYGIFFTERDYALVTRNPSVSLEDTTTDESTWLYGSTIEYFGEERSVRVTDSVRIYRGTLSAVCDTAWYYRESGLVRLTGSPEIYDEEKTISGSMVSLFLKGNLIERMVAEGASKVTMQVKGAADANIHNELKGSSIEIRFVDNKIKQMTARRNAQSRYYMFENGENQGANIATGETITLLFSGSVMEKVIVEGGSEGLFYPPDLVEKELNETDRSMP